MPSTKSHSDSDDLTIAILAGGASTRMGSDKAGVVVDSVPMLSRVAAACATLGLRRIIVGRAPGATWESELEVVADTWPGAGPLGGLHTALSAAGTDVLLLGCDMPWVSTEALRWLIAERTVHSGGVVAERERIEPLFAVYPASSCTEIKGRLERGERSLMGLIRLLGLPTVRAPDALWRSLDDADEPRDLERRGNA